MTVSIVIPALNEEGCIASCLAALTAIHVPQCSTEVIVVDNGSTDRTVAIAREFGARVLIRPGLRIGALRNAGVREATGDVLAFVDADCVVSAQWLPAALACFARTNGTVVGNFYTAPPDAGWLAATSERIASQKRATAAYLPGGNMLVTRPGFEAIGGFDERLETNEDVDFCARIRRNGGSVVCDSAITCVHLGVPRSTAAFVRREMWFGRTALRLFWNDLNRVTNLRVILFSLYFALLTVGAGLAAVAAAMTGRPGVLAGPAVALFLVVVWIGHRVDAVAGRRAWAAEVAYNVLYGFARGAALIQVAAVSAAGVLVRHTTAAAEARR